MQTQEFQHFVPIADEAAMKDRDLPARCVPRRAIRRVKTEKADAKRVRLPVGQPAETGSEREDDTDTEAVAVEAVTVVAGAPVVVLGTHVQAIAHRNLDAAADLEGKTVLRVEVIDAVALETEQHLDERVHGRLDRRDVTDTGEVRRDGGPIEVVQAEIAHNREVGSNPAGQVHLEADAGVVTLLVEEGQV